MQDALALVTAPRAGMGSSAFRGFVECLQLYRVINFLLFFFFLILKSKSSTSVS